ncbi:SseB family protein [Nesterenkonia populi]|uniref:SseB family protein n=1 Tax=Nesterenkonia populi TaxID=1591087 RepID=UPI0011BFC2AE|nr:SseB family protein [Nesterenkonia populi]
MTDQTPETEYDLSDLKSILVAAAANADANDKQYLDDDISAIFTSFLQVVVHIPSVSAADDDGFAPLLMKGLDGGSVLPIYTSDQEIPSELREQVETVAEVPGAGVVQSLANIMVVIDHGTAHQFFITSDQWAWFRSEVLEGGEGE